MRYTVCWLFAVETVLVEEAGWSKTGCGDENDDHNDTCQTYQPDYSF